MVKLSLTWIIDLRFGALQSLLIKKFQLRLNMQQLRLETWKSARLQLAYRKTLALRSLLLHYFQWDLS